MTAVSALAMVPSIMIGIAVVQLLMPEYGLAKILFKLFLGIGLGFGMTSCLFYFWRLVLPAQENGYLLFEFLILIFLWIAVIRRGVPASESEESRKIEYDPVTLWVLIAVLAAMVVIAGMSFIAYQQANPHGAYDAWAIWNLHARMLFRGGESWQNNFSSHLYHADYADGFRRPFFCILF